MRIQKVFQAQNFFTYIILLVYISFILQQFLYFIYITHKTSLVQQRGTNLYRKLKILAKRKLSSPIHSYLIFVISMLIRQIITYHPLLIIESVTI